MKINKSKYAVYSIILLSIGFICWDLVNSYEAYVENGTFRLESEFDVITSPTTPVKVAVVPSDYSGLAAPVSRTTDLNYTQVEAMVRKAIELQGGFTGIIAKGNKVMLKPNIVEKNTPSGWGTNTDVRVIKALIKIIAEFTQGDVEIIVAEGIPREGYDDPNSSVSSWQATGYRALLTDPYLSGINFSLFNLNQPYEDLVDFDLTGIGTAAPHNYQYKVHKKELEVDVYISVPVLKIHDTGITCGLKNQIGTAPGAYYGYNKCIGTAYYPGLVHDQAQRRWTCEEIVDFCIIADIDFVVVDAIMCLETDKTYLGTNQVRYNTIIAGYDPVSVDNVCARLMGQNPDDITHITLAEKVGLGTNDNEHINVVGAPISEVQKLVKKGTVENAKWGQSNRSWLLSKTYPATTVTTAAIAGEASYVPVSGVDNWSQPTYFFDDRIDLSSYYVNTVNVVSYAFAYFDAPADEVAELWLGYGEGIIVYLNGSEVFKFTSNASYTTGMIGSEKVDISLKAGRNTLLVKTLNTTGDYSFALNICVKTTNLTLNGNRVDGLKFYTPEGNTGIFNKFKVDYAMNVFPNPCSEFVKIHFNFPKPERATIDIYDISGKYIANIGKEIYTAGEHEVTWNLTGNNSNKVVPGMYFCTIRSGKYQQSKQIIVR